MIEVLPLGAGQDVGRSCIIVSVGNKRVMFDCGMHMGYHDERRFPDFSLVHPDQLDLVIISHFHLDHCGALPFLTGVVGYKGPIVMTAPTRTIAPLLLEDYRKIVVERKAEMASKNAFFTNKMIEAAMAQVMVVGVEETVDVDGISVTAFYAGHVLGAAMFMIKVGPFTCLYTGDYNMTPDRHLGAARLPPRLPTNLQLDLLITETTYATTVRESKRSRERDFLRAVHKCVLAGGKVLIPTFALGRAQELCLLMDNYWTRMGLDGGDAIPIYFSAGLAEKANDYYGLHLDWTNESVKQSIINTPNLNPFQFKNIRVFERHFADQPGPMVLFSTPGMLHSGQSLHVFAKWASDPRNMLIIPGYCVAGTVGAKVLAGHKRIMVDLSGDTQSPVPVDVNMQVKNLSFSAHADSKGILQLIKQCKPRHVMLVHGERQKMAVLRRQVETMFPDCQCHDPANGQYVYIEPNYKSAESVFCESDLVIATRRRQIQEAADIVMECGLFEEEEKRRLLRLSHQAQSRDNWNMLVMADQRFHHGKIRLTTNLPYVIMKRVKTTLSAPIDILSLQRSLILQFHPYLPVHICDDCITARTVKLTVSDTGEVELTWEGVEDEEIAKAIADYWSVTRINQSMEMSRIIQSAISTTFRRSPIVTIMGHVDHGKTTLLDRLRKANVAAGEPGGITQHLGAFTVSIDPHGDHQHQHHQQQVCFLDTPGHAAFKAVREHGTAVTDLVILVIAVDDGVMPTTKEAVSLAQRLRLPLVVALSKCDLFQSTALMDRKRHIARQLESLNVLVEGEPTFGDTQAVMVSGVTGRGLTELMMAVLAQAELLEDDQVVVDTEKPGSGFIIEATKNHGFGDTASVILKNGRLQVGEWVVAGDAYGRVKTITGQSNQHLACLLPSTPAVVTGWRSTPVAGEEVVAVASEAEAKELAMMIMNDRQLNRLSLNKTVMAKRTKDNLTILEQYRIKLAERQSRRNAIEVAPKPTDDIPQLDVILKADVQGSVEAIKQALSEIPNKKARVNVVVASQGDLTVGDVEMARCCKSPLILLFNLHCPRNLQKLLTHHKIPLVESNIIYSLLDEVERRLRSLLPKIEAVEVLGEAKVQQLFQVSHGKSPHLVAGCMVTDRSLQTGRIARENERFAYRLVRDGQVVWVGGVRSMRHGREEVSRVAAGMECGLMFEGSVAVLVGDVVQWVRVYQQEPALY